MPNKSKKHTKKKASLSVAVDIEVTDSESEEKITREQFYKALDKVIESEKKKGSKDS